MNTFLSLFLGSDLAANKKEGGEFFCLFKKMVFNINSLFNIYEYSAFFARYRDRTVTTYSLIPITVLPTNARYGRWGRFIIEMNEQ